jgi:hypothetical protein
MSYTKKTYMDLGKLGEDFELTITYYTLKAYPETREEPGEKEGFEITAIKCDGIGCLMEIYNQDGDFAAEILEIVGEEHEEFEREE